MPRIIGFTGPAGSGKDTAGAYLVQRYGFCRLSFAAPLKAALTAMGFPEPKTVEEKDAVIPLLGVSWRRLATTLGTEWGRDIIHPNIWVLMVQKYMNDNPIASFVFTDVRFENEAAMIRDSGGTVVHLRERRGDVATQTAAHRSEGGIEFKYGDVAVDNGGTLPYLEDQLNKILQK